jgi:ribosomal protein S18 acetylase RimI-like enzyme
VELRDASDRDIEAIAGLHADSWRRNYRGAYSDRYLDHEVVADRMQVWTDLLAAPRPGEFTLVAERDGEVVGFAHTIVDHDPRWGALLDNLHIRHELKRGGVGSRLMAETARVLLGRVPASRLYLWVLEQNRAAQAFYESRGGRRVELSVRGPFPGGGTAGAFRYAWSDPCTLLADGRVSPRS